MFNHCSGGPYIIIWITGSLYNELIPWLPTFFKNWIGFVHIILLFIRVIKLTRIFPSPQYLIAAGWLEFPFPKIRQQGYQVHELQYIARQGILFERVY